MSSDERPYIDKTNPEAYKAMVEVSRQVRKAGQAAGISRALSELVNVRVSQLNGCPACLSVHVPAARRAGVSDLKLDLLPCWQDATVFNTEERVSLELAEALTFGHAKSGTLSGPELELITERAQSVLGTEALAALEWTIISINAFNRISIASDHPPYEKNY